MVEEVERGYEGDFLSKMCKYFWHLLWKSAVVEVKQKIYELRMHWRSVKHDTDESNVHAVK